MARAVAVRVELIADAGMAAGEPEHFFRSPEFLAAEGVTHTLLAEAGGSSLAMPLVVRDIPGGGVDAGSPYAYPGAKTSGRRLDAADLNFSSTDLVSVFVRERIGEPALGGARERSVVLVSDPGLKRKSRMSDRQQMRKNEAAGYSPAMTPGAQTSPEQRAAFHRVYLETMDLVAASDRYRFEAGYFGRLFASPASWLFEVLGPGGEVAAAAIVVRSDGFVHYYLSGTAGEHRRRAPSKNLITAATDFADQLDEPMNLGGGITPGDGLEEFKRGFANTELPFRTHELICDSAAYARLAAGYGAGDFFPAYRASTARSG